jgi:16S rRNA (guanine(966)-N(2))-methyltransferase RsmD
LRVISGSARGRILHPPVGRRVRPTADRVKEALFSSLSSRFGSFEDLSILDLFSGSGSLGIEALSRGSKNAVFVDSHPESISLSRENLKLTGFDKAATLLMMDAVKALQHLSDIDMSFDIILVDPPYADKETTDRVITLLGELSLTSLNGVLVFETDNRSELHVPENFLLFSKKVYGDTSIWMFERID